MTEIQIPDLNEDQITAILVEGLARGAYESPTGAPPENKGLRDKDAKDMVSLCIRASVAGNKSPLVESILFIAQCDTKPNLKEKENKTVTLDDWDFSQVSDKVLAQLIKTVEEQIESPTTLQQKTAFLAEKEKRANENQSTGQEVEEVTSGEDSGETARQGNPQLSEEGMQSSGQAQPEGMGETGSRHEEATVTPEHVSTTEDAGAFAGAQVTESGEKGIILTAESQEKDGERDKLVEQLTLPMVEAHKIDINKINDLPIKKLRMAVENPDGPPAESADNSSKDKEDMQITSKPKDQNSVAGMDMDAVAEVKLISKEDMGIESEQESAQGETVVTSSREKLEEQLKGTTLKVYGRGRKEVPNIGDNELKLMIDNPEGKITPQELEDARKIDNGEPLVITAQEILDESKDIQAAESALEKGETRPADEVLKEIDESDNDPVAAAKKMLEDAEVEAEKKKKEDVIRQEEFEEVQEMKDHETIAKRLDDESKEESLTQAAQRVTSEPNNKSGTVTALDILSKENLPLPPEISDNPPILPNDISKCTRDEIYSYHARFHACESRSNFIISNFEDELSDFSFLKKNREVDIQAAIPAEMDGKRTTQDYRDLMAAADPEVKDLKSKEHELNKVVKKLKVSRDYYHLSCERLSRQMSKYETEKSDSPR